MGFHSGILLFCITVDRIVSKAPRPVIASKAAEYADYQHIVLGFRFL
jgi:hypothetical protein